MRAGDGINDADGTEVVAFGKLMGGKGPVIEQPHAELQGIEFGRQRAEINGKKGLGELALKVIETDFELASFFEPEAMGGVCDAL